MDRPAKRMKTWRADSSPPSDADSRLKEGPLTSEHGTRSQEAKTSRFRAPTRTIVLSDMQPGRYLDVPRHRPKLERRNAAVHLVPRVPDATVTANVVDVNVNVGSTTLDATVVAAATSEVLVSVNSLGVLTVPVAPSSYPTDSSTITTNMFDTSQSVLSSTPPTTPLPSDTTFTSSTLAGTITTSIPLSTLSRNGTITESTVTITATSTLEVSYTNGTFLLPSTHTTLATSKAMSITDSSHQSTLKTSTKSSQQSSNSYVFGSTEPTRTSYQSGSIASSTAYGGTGGTSGTGSTVSSGSSTGAAASASSSSSSGSGSSGPGLTPTQQTVVGGVLGGVAGIALVLLVVLVVLRWYRRRLQSHGRLPEQQLGATRNISTSGGDSFPPMSERSSNVPLAAAVASFGRRMRPQSSNTVTTTATGATSTTAPEAERGFQRIAGRKIAPVMSAGGDQYGGNYGAFERNTARPAPPMPRQPPERELAGTSFYRDSGGFYGGRGPQSSTPPPVQTMPSAPPPGRSLGSPCDLVADSPSIAATKPEGFAVLRPSPARTPVTRSPSTSSIKLPIQQGPILEPEAPATPALPAHLLAPRDAIGRSLGSQDGSRVSRASKGSGSRFSERL